MHRYITYPAYAYQIGRYSDSVSNGHKKKAHRVKPVRLLFISDYLVQRSLEHGVVDKFERDAGVGLVGAGQVDAIDRVAWLADKHQRVEGGFARTGVEDHAAVRLFDYLEGDVIALDRGDAEAVGGTPLGHADGVGVVGRCRSS